MNTSTKKSIIWLIGLLLALIIFVFIKTIDYFYFLNDPNWLPLIIILVLIILFFFLGKIISKTPTGLYSLRLKDSNIDEINKKVNLDFKEEEVDVFVNNIRHIMDYLSKTNYSKDNVDNLTKFVGFDKDITINLIKNSRKLRYIKLLYWFLGIIFSISTYFVLINYDYFSYISSIWFLPLSISLVVFLLFYSEGIFATKMPNSFYLNILNINKRKVIDTEKEITEKSKVYDDFKNKEKDSINRLKNTLAYLQKMKVKEDVILELLERQGFNAKTAKKLIDTSKEHISKVTNIKIDDKSAATLKLFVSKVHDEFTSLKDIYDKINSIDKEIKELKDKQNDLENISKIKVDSSSVKQIVSAKNNKKEINSDDIPNSQNYENKIEFIFNLIKPYAEKYSEKDLRSFLLSQNYDLYIIDDVIDKLKENNILFSSKNKSISENLVYLINNIYDKFSKNN